MAAKLAGKCELLHSLRGKRARRERMNETRKERFKIKSDNIAIINIMLKL